jgi:hypothetical protein
VIGAGTVISPIIKIVTTVAILAAIGFFIVRPILDTTDKAIDSAGDQIRRAQQHAAQGRGDDARRVRDCVKRAEFKPAAMQRCNTLADRLLFG